MAFISAFLSRTPDAEPDKHTAKIETPMHTMYAVMVKDQAQAVEVCKKLISKNGVQAITLCPGFTNQNVGEIAGAAGDSVSVTVARGDGQGVKLTSENLRKAGWFK